MTDARIVALNNMVKKIGVDDDEAHILNAIKIRVAELMDKNPELLMSYLYRLDVLEKDLNAVLNNPAPVSLVDSFSLLIWERQKKRLETKIKFKQEPIEGWEY